MIQRDYCVLVFFAKESDQTYSLKPVITNTSQGAGPSPEIHASLGGSVGCMSLLEELTF